MVNRLVSNGGTCYGSQSFIGALARPLSAIVVENIDFFIFILISVKTTIVAQSIKLSSSDLRFEIVQKMYLKMIIICIIKSRKHDLARKFSLLYFVRFVFLMYEIFSPDLYFLRLDF
jgi:hypothetical protein